MMSFRRQLVLSLAVLVLVPALIATTAIARLLVANENAKTDARLQASAQVVTAFERGAAAQAARRAARLETSPRLRAALRSADRSAITATIADVLASSSLVGARITFPSGYETTLGDRSALGVAQVRAPLGQRGDSQQVALAFGAVQPQALVDEVRRASGSPAAILLGGRVIARSQRFPTGAVDLGSTPPRGGDTVRIETLALRTLDPRTDVTVVLAIQRDDGALPLGAPLLLAILVAFLSVGLGLGLLLVRALRLRIERFLGAAEQLGQGDFSAASAIPTRGGDEFALLGRAFVGMAQQLDQRVDQLQQERARVQNSLLRLGKAFAANLDRDTLIELVVESAVDGLTADAGRALIPSGDDADDGAVARGSFGSVLDAWDALGEVERRVLSRGGSAAAEAGGLHAIAEPMRIGREEDALGVISVARHRPFSDDERDVLRYLTEQAAVSLANVGRHEDVARESITDELTGLANRRRFDDVLASVATRATEEDPIGLVMVDLDHFKRINDEHGHPFGDTVLQAVASVIKETARDRDLPARYGGEELAVVLATGDSSAAERYAERLRTAIAELELGDAETGPVPITASLGVASLPRDGSTAADLVRAADDALYRAKRDGRNRVQAASPEPLDGQVG